MAPTSEKMNKNVRLLVANKSVMEPDKAFDKFKCPFFKEADGVYFVDEEDDFNNIVSKMGHICKKTVSRLYYIDSDNDEVPIDGELELKEAMKFIRDRTDKGKFTTMKIETGSPSKSTKKKVKKMKSKAGSKANEPNPPQKASKKSSDPISHKKEVLTKSKKMEEPPVWFENYMNQFKIDFMADMIRNFGNLLKPLFEEQMKLSASICPDNSGGFDYIKTSASAGVSKMLTEADHNYSVISCSQNGQESKSFMRENSDSVTSDFKVYENLPINKGEEIDKKVINNGDCSAFVDDDNLSIYSGVISITDSESEVDGGLDDFVDVPFPACFNVVDPQGVIWKKELKHLKAEKKPKTAISEPPSRAQEDETKPLCQSNFTNSSGHNASITKRCDSEEAQDTNLHVKEAMANANNNFLKNNICHVKTSGIKVSESQDADEREINEIKEKFVDACSEDHDEFCAEEDANQNKSVHTASSVFHQMPLDQNAKLAQVSSQQPKEQIFTTSSGYAFQQNNKFSVEAVQRNFSGNQSALPQEDIPTLPNCGQQYIMPSGPYSNSRRVPGVTRKVSLFNSARQGVLYPQQGMLVPMPTGPVSAQNTYLQQIQKQGLQQPLQSYNSSVLQQPSMFKLQPPHVQQAVMKATQQLANLHLLEAQAAVYAQHQQVVQAAQRAALQASQQAHVLAQVVQQQSSSSPTALTQQQVSMIQSPLQGVLPSVSHQENSTTVNTRIISHDENSTSVNQNSLSNASQGESQPATNQKTATIPNHSVPHQSQDAAQEVKLWNEVDQVDQELRKWVQMCQQLIEQIPNRADESPQTMPESLKTLAATAIKTHQDLERVYQRFRKEVQIASSQVDGQKKQKQHQQVSGNTLSGEPVSILPRKLLQIIESTLSATFSILGNITKLGVVNASISASPEHNSRPPAAAAAAMEKPQPQVAAVVSPSTSANVRIGYTQSVPYQYYYPYLPASSNDSHSVSSCGIFREALENRDGSMTYRLHPMTSHGTYGSNYSSTFKYPVGEFQPQPRTPIRVVPQAQLQQHQTVQVNHTQQPQPQQQRPLQQTHLQQPAIGHHQQVQLLQQVIRDSSAARQNSRIDNSFATFNMEDFSKWR